MQPRKRFIRLLKFLGKLILGLLLLLFLLFAALHTPVVQKQITGRISTYLSTRLGSKVQIDRIAFSIFGDLSIGDLEIWDPEHASILGVEKIKLKASWRDLFRGRYLFDEVRIEGMKGRLVEDERGINIQFIINAFQSEESRKKTPVPVTLDFKKVILERIGFEFVSLVSGFSLKTNFEKFEASDVEYVSQNNRIKAGDIIFENGLVDILHKPRSDSAQQKPDEDNENPFSPDFGMGIGFDIKSLDIRNGSFSIHEDTIFTTSKFDAAHIDLREIQLSVKDVMINTDTLAASVKNARIGFPVIAPVVFTGEIGINRQYINLKGIQASSGNNTFTADLKSLVAKSDNGFHIDADAHALINTTEFEYFLDDEWVEAVRDYPHIDLQLKSRYEVGRGNVTLLNLKTPHSRIEANGVVNHVFDFDRLAWENVSITSTIGEDLRKSLQQITGDLAFPASMNVQVNSTGNLNEIQLDGKLNASIGEIDAKGVIRPIRDNTEIDLLINTRNFKAGQFLDIAWMGMADVSIQAKGHVGDQLDLVLKGTAHSLNVFDQQISDIDIDGRMLNDSISGHIHIKDPDYPIDADVRMTLEDPMTIQMNGRLTDVNLSRLLKSDSSIYISGNIAAVADIGQNAIEGFIKGDSVLIRNAYGQYLLDSIAVDAFVSDDSSHIHYLADGDEANIKSNFHLEDIPLIVETKMNEIMHSASTYIMPEGDREMQFDVKLNHPGPFIMMGLPVEQFEGIELQGVYSEPDNTFRIEGNSGKLKMAETELDSAQISIVGEGDTMTSNADVWNLVYDSVALGALVLEVTSDGDTAVSNLRLLKDTMILVDLEARVIPADSMVIIIPDQLTAYGNSYTLDAANRIYVRDGNVEWEQFLMTREDMQLKLNGDMSAMEADFLNLDLTTLNLILFPDSAIIEKGKLTGKAIYTKGDQLSIDAKIDSLILYESIPMTVTMTADSKGDEVPFQFLLSSADNTVDVKGTYSMKSEKVDAKMVLDVSQLEMFAFLVSDVLDELKGQAKGEASISGTLKDPDIDGEIRLTEVDVTTANPKLSFTIKDDVIRIENSKLLAKDLTLYDDQQHALHITGFVEAKSSATYAYDLHFKTDGFTLLNIPGNSKEQVRGLLMVSADMSIRGDQLDTEIKGDLAILDTTSLVYVYESDEADLLQTEGIVEFVDPASLEDTVSIEENITLYDSLLNSLPEFVLDSKLEIKDDVKIRVVTNEQSGDYFEATGGGILDLDYNRTGQMNLAGTYSIKQGVYRISFYGLVKKNFRIVPGSTVKWSGAPDMGEIVLSAVDTVRSNSVGLVGDEVSESEKSTYKRTLPYIIRVKITGTLSSPEVTFTLDLPETDKANYPVLARKLERLQSPEYQSELNKQIFGLLALGGFLPETSGAEINSNQIASTAIYNSVNSLLSSQLNRLTGQYIKGVDIDVGIQSYADYSTPGGRPQTAVDVRVSKSILNDRLSFEVGGDFDINTDQSGANTGDNYRGDVAIIYDLTGDGDKLLKLFNNETYDIIYQEIRNTGISLVFIREFDKGDKRQKKKK